MPVRMGSFAAPTTTWGLPSNIDRPTNNDYGSLYDAALLNLGGLSQADLQDLQGRIQDLYETLKAERQYA